MNILCIDDDLVFGTTIKHLLMTHSPFSTEVTLASSGQDGIELFRSQRFDLVFTDLVMPGMSGIEVILEIKEIAPQTEVIVLTGQYSIDTAVEAMKQGARDYLTKPINGSELLERLSTINDLLTRKNDAEDLRFAKEIIESDAHRTISTMELKLSDLTNSLNEIRTIINSQLDIKSKLDKIRIVVDESNR